MPLTQKTPRWRSRVLAGDEIGLLRECRYVVGLAAQGDARVVTRGPLILFASETGDAWMLDPVDDRALRLARGRAPVVAEIDETARRVSVEWTHTYRLHSEWMTFVDDQGRVETVSGYPTREIGLAIRRVGRRPLSRARRARR